MKTIKKRTKILILSIIGLIVSIPIVCIIGFFVVLAQYTLEPYFAPDLPAPVIQEAEFEFELIYSLDGDEHIVRDVFVCEYTGPGMLGDGSWGSARKGRTWKGYIKSTGEEGIVLGSDKMFVTECFVGDAGYYMGDPDYPENPYLLDKTGFKVSNYSRFPWITGSILQFYIDVDVTYEVEVISFEIEEPIENTFK